MAELTPEEELALHGKTYSLLENGWEVHEGVFIKTYGSVQASLLYRPGKTIRVTVNDKSEKIDSLLQLEDTIQRML